MAQVVVIEAGIVGLATAFHLPRDGLGVTLIDRDPAGNRASHDAGGIAVTEVIPASVPGLLWKAPGWLFDPLGPFAIRPRHAWRLVPSVWRFARAGRPASVDRISQALAAQTEASSRPRYTAVYGSAVPQNSAGSMPSQTTPDRAR